MSNNNTPLANLVKELDANGIKVYGRQDGADVLLQCVFKDKLKKDTPQGFEVLGRAPALVERISSAVFRYFPKAELTSQAANMYVVYKLNMK